MELLVVMFAFLASIFTLAFITNVRPEEHDKVGCDINIEELIDRHGEIIYLSEVDYSDIDKLYMPVEDYVDDYLLPKRESITIGTVEKCGVIPRAWSTYGSRDHLRCRGQQPKYKNRSWSRKYGQS